MYRSSWLRGRGAAVVAGGTRGIFKTHPEYLLHTLFPARHGRIRNTLHHKLKALDSVHCAVLCVCVCCVKEFAFDLLQVCWGLLLNFAPHGNSGTKVHFTFVASSHRVVTVIHIDPNGTRLPTPENTHLMEIIRCFTVYFGFLSFPNNPY